MINTKTREIKEKVRELLDKDFSYQYIIIYLVDHYPGILPSNMIEAGLSYVPVLNHFRGDCLIGYDVPCLLADGIPAKVIWEYLSYDQRYKWQSYLQLVQDNPSCVIRGHSHEETRVYAEKWLNNRQ